MLKGNEPSDSTSGSDTIIIDRNPLSEHGEPIPALNPSPDGGHATGRSTAGPSPYGSNKGGTIGPSAYGGNTASPSPYGLNTSRPSPYGDHTSSLSPYGHNTSGPSPYGGLTPSPSPYGFSTFGPSPYRGHTINPSTYGLNTSGPSPYGDHTPSPPLYGHDTPGPSLYGGHKPSPSLYDLSSSGPSPGGGHAAGSPASVVNQPDSGQAARLPPDRRDAGSSFDEGNIPYGQQAENAWTPCDGCKGEVERILREKRRIDEVISKIDPDRVRELQTLCELIGERHRDSPSSPSGQQELFPGSVRLFHSLFDHFFIVEECQNAPLVALAVTPLEIKESGSLTVKKLTQS